MDKKDEKTFEHWSTGKSNYRSPPKSNPWSRKHRVTAMFTTGELADMMLIAESWKCSPAMVLWALFAEWSATLRHRDLMALPYAHSSKAIIARARILEYFHENEFEANQGGDGPEPGVRCGVCGYFARAVGDAGEGGAGGEESPGAAPSGAESGGERGGPVSGAGHRTEKAGKV